MKISKQAGFLHLSFQEPDWNNPSGGAYEIIKELKISFVHASPANNGMGWDYDQNAKEWTLPDTEINQQVLTSIIGRFLSPNENQTKLF